MIHVSVTKIFKLFRIVFFNLENAYAAILCSTNQLYVIYTYIYMKGLLDI